MEGVPKNPRAGRGMDYIDVEVLPPEGKTNKADDLDPFIKLISRLLDMAFRTRTRSVSGSN